MTQNHLASLWRSPSGPLSLDGLEVHIWRAELDLPASVRLTLAQTLAADEWQRASQFRFSRDRSRFIAARAALRGILGRYLERDPRTLRFSYNEYGKPALIEETEGRPLFFNLAHSHNLAVYAITHRGDVGIDLEHSASDGANYDQIAERFFSPNEVRVLQAIPAESKQEAFLNCWTRKEAYIKARGLGLSLDLQLFDVSLTPGEPAAFLAIREEGQESANWSLYDFAPGPGYIAALAVQGEPASIAYWQWLESPI